MFSKEIELINTELPEGILRLIFEVLKNRSDTLLETVKITNFDIRGSIELNLELLLTRRGVKTLHLSGCQLTSKMLGKLCFGIINGKTLENLAIKENKLGINYLTKTTSLRTFCATSSNILNL